MKTYKVLCLVLFASFLVMAVEAQPIVTVYTTDDGLPDNYITGGIAIASDNTIWAGTNMGIAKFDGVNWTAYTTEDGLIDNLISYIAVDNSDNVWVGTEVGVSKFDGTDFTNFTTSDGLLENDIKCIAVDDAGNIYFATFNGMSIYNGSSFQNYTTAQGLPSDLIKYIKVVSPTEVWIGTVDGLAKFDGSSFEVFDTDDGLISNDISSIAVGTDNSKWIGSFYGIDVLSSSNIFVTSHNYEDGLYAPYAAGIYHNYVQDVKVDVYGNVWATEYVDYLQDGALCYFKNSEWQTVYTTTQPVEFMETDNDGVAWVATGDGVVKVDIYVGVKKNNLSADPVIYPNPVATVINVQSNEALLGYTIFDVSGKELCKGVPVMSNQISVENLSSGLYFIELNMGKRNVKLSFVK